MSDGQKWIYSEEDALLFAFVHEKLIEQLRFIDSVCKKHNIIYFPNGGSMLGMVRDKGFIPWDDDLDLMMTRENYEKFNKVVMDDLGDIYNYTDHGDKLFHLEYNTTPVFNGTPIEGISTDILVLDRLYDNPKKRRRQIFLTKVLQGMLKQKPAWKSYGRKEKLLVFATYTFGKLFTVKYKQKIFRKICNAPESMAKEYYYMSNSLFCELELPLPQKAFKKPVHCDFYGIEVPFPTPENAVDILTIWYGDYMTPPPEDKREILHITRPMQENMTKGGLK